jgi:hypothetical protein
MTTVYNKASEIAIDLSNRLKAITVANGYETDIGLRSYRGRTNIDEDSVPCSVLIEGEDKMGRSSGLNNVQVLQDYVLGGYVKCDPNNPNDAAHAILRDLKKAVFKDGSKMGGVVRNVEYRGRNIGARADGRPIVFAIIHITVEYAEDLTNP